MKKMNDKRKQMSANNLMRARATTLEGTECPSQIRSSSVTTSLLPAANLLPPQIKCSFDGDNFIATLAIAVNEKDERYTIRNKEDEEAQTMCNLQMPPLHVVLTATTSLPLLPSPWRRAPSDKDADCRVRG
jgi:hypothetical protein